MKLKILSITAVLFTTSLATSAQAEAQCQRSGAVLSCRNATIQLSDSRRDREDYYRALNRIYREVLGRNADRDGLESWSRKLDKGKSLRDVREDIADSSEARDAVNRLYRELTGRDGSRDMIKDYTERLGQGWSLNQVRSDITGSRDYRRTNTGRRRSIVPSQITPLQSAPPTSRPPIIPPLLPGRPY